MPDVLVYLGGGFYLLNKILLSFSEHAIREEKKVFARRCKIASWIAYIFGLPAWVLIFADKRDWIAAALEASGGPTMVLGLVVACRGQSKDPPGWLDGLAVISAILGFLYSLYDFGGLNELSQWLEIGLASGFLIGTYRLAKDKSDGYPWFVLMHICCGYLMYTQGHSELFYFQVASLPFVVDAYFTAVRKKK